MSTVNGRVIEISFAVPFFAPVLVIHASKFIHEEASVSQMMQLIKAVILWVFQFLLEFEADAGLPM